MCSECLHTPCLTGCPNAPEPEPIYICTECGDGIMEGDMYLRIGGKILCESCVDELTEEA